MSPYSEMPDAGASYSRLSLYRIMAMSFCFNFLADYLWIPVVAYAKDNAWSPSLTGAVFAVNLGSRFVPNLLTTKIGLKSELSMMAFVFAGYATSFAFPKEQWSIFIMAACSGMGFSRAALTLHVQLAFGDDETAAALASSYCGSARNLGTIIALIVPVGMYELLGWTGVCAGGMMIALFNMIMSAAQQAAVRSASEKLAEADGEKHREHIPWIYWVIGAAFVVTELQFNICNAAVPMTLTRSFGVETVMVGRLMASFNGLSMCFLACRPSLTCGVLNKSPVNMIFAFCLIAISWSLAMLATLLPFHGLELFVSSVLIFLISSYFAQVLMLECISGVCEGPQAKILMGVSETLGCGFAMAGGYLGDSLEEYGAAAPFALQTFVGLVTLIVLAASFGHRRMTQLAALEADCASAITANCGGCLQQCVTGLGFVVGRTHSATFIGSERKYRRSLSRGRTASALSAPLLQEPGCLSDSAPVSPAAANKTDVETGGQGHAASAIVIVLADSREQMPSVQTSDVDSDVTFASGGAAESLQPEAVAAQQDAGAEMGNAVSECSEP